ncbi:MAG: alpha-amylase family glycosyl hydrolase [Acidimicrobiia bacterium]|nr:alpha-amylase family glycosyl hydrolase [Acidimicrobiia bacterium]MDH3397276.1 alpha-amylase family glycosyl hydrolase [Acidimicrobiia bacterium]
MTGLQLATTTDHPWWQTAVIYQIYPRSFQDSTGNGIGDLAGVIKRLDYLADTLGVDAIWLSPFFPSPMKDFGYDVSDYCNVDPLFGDLATFDRLVVGSHARNLKVIIDWVPNHSSDQHPWFIESRSSPNNPKRDWYVWRDPKPDGAPPNNWAAAFGGGAWEWDQTTSQYYLHSFLKEQPDLNWRNPAVEEAMLDTLRFWLDRGVDGFRIDVAHHIMKDPELSDNPVAAEISDDFALAPYATQRHVNDRGHPDVHEIFRKVRALLDRYHPPRYSVGEIHEYDWPTWASYYGENLDGLHMPFNFAMLQIPWTAEGIREVVERVEEVVPAGAWPNYVLGNHDEIRMTTRLGHHQSRIAAMLLLTLRGTPTLYYGDEIGLGQADLPPHLQQDPWGRTVPGKGRDGCRTPMQWTDGEGSGFTDPGVRPWLPLSGDAAGRNVSKQVASPNSLVNLYRRLLVIRDEEAALQVGDYRSLESDRGVFAYLRDDGQSRLAIILNFTGDAQPAGAIATSGSGHVVISTGLDRAGPLALEELELGPHEGVIIRLD